MQEVFFALRSQTQKQLTTLLDADTLESEYSSIPLDRFVSTLSWRGLAKEHV